MKEAIQRPVYVERRRDELERGDVFNHGGSEIWFAVASNAGRRREPWTAQVDAPYLCVPFRHTPTHKIVQRDGYSYTDGRSIVEHVGKAVFKPNSDVVESFQPSDGVKDRRILRQRRRKQQRGGTS